MTFTYNPSASPIAPRDLVRMYVGDVDGTDPQLQDGEITAILLDEGNNVMRAAATAADTIGSRYAGQASEGGRQAAVLMQHYLDLATRLRRKMARTGVAPLAPSLSVSQKQAVEQDSDRVQPFFRRAMDSEPGTEPDGGDTPTPPPPLYY